MGDSGDVRSTSGGVRVSSEHDGQWRSIGGLHGSARGRRNVTKRIALMDELVEMSGDALLDVGCGTGEYTTALAERFSDVDAVDIEMDRLDIFSQSCPDNVTIRCESVSQLPFDDGHFNVVTMIEVLEHLPSPEVATVEIARVLSPGGHLVITTPNRSWPFEQHGIPMGSKRLPGYVAPGLPWVKSLHERLSDAGAFSRRDLRRLADEAGLDLVGVSFMMPPLDSLGSDHRIHKVLDRLEASRLSRFGQTIVGAFRKPVS